MNLGRHIPPYPRNEPVLSYAPGTMERSRLQDELHAIAATPVEIPVVIGGERIRTGDLGVLRAPHDHAIDLGRFHRADRALALKAADAALAARASWSRTPLEHRMAIFLKAAELLSCRYRARVNAVAMLSLGKTAHQAEIDAVCEMADFFRFNVQFMHEIYGMQPENAPNAWNRMEWRPLEGFVFAATPFNFASIAGNLPSAPAMMGNTVVWKPASSAVYPAWVILEVLEEAGLPPGVINFVPGSGAAVGDPLLSHPELAGVHFTGSTETFRRMWQTISHNIKPAHYWPRIVGETGGKDFVFAHATADVPALSTALVRGAFEYQGQKCSAASRAYIPASLWPALRERLLSDLARLRMGPVTDFSSFMTAVIDESAFDAIRGEIEGARRDPSCEILHGGGCDGSRGWYVEPTVILASDPGSRTMAEEIFGPVLTIFVYPDEEFVKTLDLCNRTSPYALTGAIFSRDRAAIEVADQRLRDAAGNFYINDKPTGAVVGRQPFGGARASGTNDKAGSLLNLLRWVSPRTIKETFDPPTEFTYPFMG
ncbi:MAG: L-glutamate gamma-semialdehyde dehydrogenase [Deltaproteobacteria bacterium]|nr:L-glutamate gamma-semialdehyde dehydrogenase [Deltaproteobacteria bacterium]